MRGGRREGYLVFLLCGGSEDLREELLDSLERAFADNQSSWDLDGEGIWHRRSVDSDPLHPEPRSLQLELAELYAARAGAERPEQA